MAFGLGAVSDERSIEATSLLDASLQRSANQRRIEFLTDLGQAGAHQYVVAAIAISDTVDHGAFTKAVSRSVRRDSLVLR